MSPTRRKKEFFFIVATVFCLFLLTLDCPSGASDPHSAYYSSDDDKIFWFIITSDVHIGARDGHGNDHLNWIVSEGRQVIDPTFIVCAGDLTDSTNESSLGYPDGPHTEEWEAYRKILQDNGVDETFYYDIPGNHDHYNDQNFDYYLNYSIQGAATGQTQISWTRAFDFGTYHFLGINTAGNDGEEFSVFPPRYGDNAGLDETELAFIEEKLENNKDADLTIIFGHHAIVSRSSEWTSDGWKEWTVTTLSYGDDEFIQLMEDYNVLTYAYGHSHIYREEFFTKNMTEGVVYFNVASLGTSEEHHFTVVAIDCNGISMVSPDINTWPVVIITTPLDKNLGMENNPYTHEVTDLSSGSNPIRALVFDKKDVTQVRYRIDQEGSWHQMTQVDPGHADYPYLWEAESDTSLREGDHIVEVRATGTSTQTDTIPTSSPAEPVSDDGDTFCFIGTAGSHYLGAK